MKISAIAATTWMICYSAVAQTTLDTAKIAATYGASRAHNEFALPADAIKIERFGAKCDGSSDDTAAMNKAFATGGHLLVNGTCLVASPLILSIAGTKLFGTGTIRLSSSWSGDAYGDGAAIIAAAQNLTIRDITIDGTDAVMATGPFFSGLLNKGDISNMVIENITINNMRFNGIYLQGSVSSNIQILRNTIRNTGWAGIGLGFCNRCVAKGNYVSATGYDSIEIDNGDGDLVAGNYTSKAEMPTYVYQGHGHADCTPSNDCGALLAITPTATNLTIDGNIFDDNSRAKADAIGLEGELGTEFPGPITITHNIVRNSGGFGIDVPGRGRVADNEVNGSLGSGIFLGFDYGGTMQNVTVSGNKVFNVGAKAGGACIQMASNLGKNTIYKNIEIKGNTCKDTRSPKLMAFGFSVYNNNSNFFNISVTGNKFSEVAKRSIFAYGAGYPQFSPPIVYSDNVLLDPEQPVTGGAFDVSGYSKFIISQNGPATLRALYNGYVGQTISIRAADGNTNLSYDTPNASGLGANRLVGERGAAEHLAMGDVLSCSKTKESWSCSTSAAGR